MDAALQDRHALEQDLRQGIERDQFEVYFQPVADPRTREVTSFEALLRWKHPTLGLTLPSDFILLLDETDCIIPVGAWALKVACQEAMTWSDAIGDSVNIAMKQFVAGDLVGTVATVLSETDGIIAECFDALFFGITADCTLEAAGTSVIAAKATKKRACRIISPR